jgi:single-strand DNA-binding protein
MNERLVDIAEKYLSKGSKVYIEGQLQTRKWTDSKTGIERYSTEVVLGKFRGELTLLDSKNNTSGEEAYRSQSSQGSQNGNGQFYSNSSQASPKSSLEELDDNIPF